MFSLDVIITGAIGIVTTICSAWTSWFFARKKYNTEVDSNIIRNLQESLEFYKRLVDDNNKRLEDVLKRNEELEKRNLKLEEDLSQVRNQVFNILGQICLDFSCNHRIRNAELFGGKK